MAQPLILSDLTNPSGGALNLVLDDRVVTEYSDAVEGLIFWRWEDEPTTFPQFLGVCAEGTFLELPFTVTESRQVRFFLVSRDADGNVTETDPRRSPSQYLWTPPPSAGDAIVTHLGAIVVHAGDVVTHSV